MGCGRGGRGRGRALLGGVLVEVTGWHALFWVDAVVALGVVVLTAVTVSESRDTARSRSIDLGGSVLVALTLTPFILALSKGSAWGWTSVATLGCFALAVAAGVGFVAVERRVAVPMLDLALLRNRILVGSTLAILIGAGTINALMYLVSLYFQDPSTLGLSPLEAGLATLPATVGLVLVAPFVPRLAARFGGRQVVGAGFAITAVGFAMLGFAEGSWLYGAFVVPLIAVAIGMGLSNGPASAAATASVDATDVGAASGVSNMARYVGAAVATALAATVYGSVIADGAAAGLSQADALADGLATASWLMAGFSASASPWRSSWADVHGQHGARWPTRPRPLLPVPSPCRRPPRPSPRPRSRHEPPSAVPATSPAATTPQGGPVNLTASFGSGDILLWMLELFLFIIWFWLLVAIFGDLFRDPDTAAAPRRCGSSCS